MPFISRFSDRFKPLSGGIDSGFIPTPTPTPTPSVTPTMTVTPTSSVTPTMTVTPTQTNTPTPSITPTQTNTPTPSVTPTQTNTPTPSITPTKTNTPTPTPTITPTKSGVVSNGQFVYVAQTGIGWNGYGANYLSFGPSQDGTNKTPLAGWYFKDSNNVVRRLLNSPLWFSGGNPSPYPNGNGWMAVANGSFYIAPTETTITFYETSPV